MRIPLGVLNDPRDYQRLKDSYGINVLLEQEEGSEGQTVKRPGRVLFADFGDSVGQGVWNYDNLAFAISSDILNEQSFYAPPLGSVAIPYFILNVGTTLIGSYSYLGESPGTLLYTSSDGVTYTPFAANAFALFLYRANDLTYGADWQYAFDAHDMFYTSNDSWATYTTIDLQSPAHVPVGLIDTSGLIFLLAAPDQQTIYLFSLHESGPTSYRYTSVDNGDTWADRVVIDTLTSTISLGLTRPAYQAFFYTPTNSYYALQANTSGVSDYRLLESSDAFLTAQDITPFTGIQQVRALGLVGDRLCIAVYNTVTSEYTLYFSVDGSYWATSSNTYPNYAAPGASVNERIYALGTRAIFYYDSV